jgi:hypothetical protein
LLVSTSWFDRGIRIIIECCFPELHAAILRVAFAVK